MIKPFHLSVVVPDLASARQFYVDLLGCKTGRENRMWIDVIFYGHQITIHQQHNGMVARAIDHFGPILGKEDWLSVSDLLKANDTEFVMQPTIIGPGCDTETGKFIVKDPAGNTLEFKYYACFSKTVD